MTQNGVPRIISLAELCLEAVARHGDNWSAVRAYVTGRLNELPADERAAFERDVERILSFDPPPRKGETWH